MAKRSATAKRQARPKPTKKPSPKMTLHSKTASDGKPRQKSRRS